MTDNVIPFKLPEILQVGDVSTLIDKARKRQQIEWMRGLCNAWEADDTGMRIAMALFVEGPDGSGQVQCGGFEDDAAAQRYFHAWIQQHGVAE